MIDIKDFLLNVLKENIDDSFTEYAFSDKNQKEEKSLYISNMVDQDNEKLFYPLYYKQNISIVVRWETNYTETRKKATEIYDYIKSISRVLLNEDTLIIRCVMLDKFPIDYRSKTKIYAQEIRFQVQYTTK